MFLEIREKDYEGGLFQNRAVIASLTGNFQETAASQRVDRVVEEIAALEQEAPRVDSRRTVFLHLADKDPVLKEQFKARITPSVHFLEELDLPLNSSRSPDFPFSAAGGLLSFFENRPGRVNLLSRGTRVKNQTPFWVTIPLLLILGALIGWYWITPIQMETRRTALIEKQIALKKGEVKKVETLKKEIEGVTQERNVISDFKQARRMTITLLKELTEIIPKDSWLTRIRISENQINIEGYAPSATLLVPKLEASPHFKKVEFASPTYRDPKLNQDRFQIKMEQE